MKYLCTVSCVMTERYKKGLYYAFNEDPNKSFKEPRFKKAVGDTQENGDAGPKSQTIRQSVPKDGLVIKPSELKKLSKPELYELAHSEGLPARARMAKPELLALFKK